MPHSPQSPRLILASSSPRRRELLAEANYQFTVMPPRDGAEPDGISGLSPAELVAELARLKGADVVQQLVARGDAAKAEDSQTTIVLAADTVAECGGRVLGKPRDEAHAREMLTWMSGRAHRVLSGVDLTVLRDLKVVDRRSEVATTELQMAPLADDWLEPFLASGGWRGKAGAFGYQDGLRFVKITAGSESNVVGLPMEQLGKLLADQACSPMPREQS